MTCPEHAIIMVIKRPVIEEPAMEGTSNADPVSSNIFLQSKKRTVIGDNCEGNHYRKRIVRIEIGNYLLNS